MSPRISVLMAVRNEAAYVASALDSLLAQSVSDFEAIVVDDGSDDATPAIVARYARDPRVTLVQPGRIGLCAALNEGYRRSSGPWLVYFSGDDLMPPRSIEDRLDAVAGRDPLRQRVGLYARLRTFSTDRRYDGLLLPRSRRRGQKGGGTLMFSRALGAVVFPLPPSLVVEDLWTRLVIDHFAEEIVHSGAVVLHYRLHDGNSVPRKLAFETYNERRFQTAGDYGVFLARFAPSLSPGQREIVAAIQRGEDLRHAGAWTGILRLRRLPLWDKIQLAVYARPRLYALRMRFYRLLSGWGT